MPFAPAAEAEAQEGAAEPPRAGRQVGVREDAVAPRERLPLRDVTGDQLLDDGEVDEHQYGSPLLCWKVKSEATKRSTSG